MFYHLNGRLPLTNSLLFAPDGEVPDGEEKINSENLYEMFQDKHSHGLVSLQFLGALGIFFGLDISISKHAVKELYKNLQYETSSGAQKIEFDAVCDLVWGVKF